MEDERTADALRESEERYRTLFEQSPVGVFLYDRDLRIQGFNARFTQILATSEAALRGLDMRSLRDQRIVPALERALTGEVSLYEGPYEATTSSAHLVITMRLAPLRSRTGAVIGGLGVVEDVTAVRASEMALRASEGRFRALIELLPDGIVVYSHQGLLLYANHAVLRAMGYANDEPLQARDIFGVLHPDDRGKALERRARLLGGVQTPPVEFRIMRKDGTFAIMEAVSIDIEFDGAAAVLTVLRDLTERRIIQAKLSQADRMVAVGTLAAGVAHEINNPLAYMKANLDVAVSRKLPLLERDAQTLAEELDALRDGARPEDSTAARLVATITQLKEMLGLALDGAERVRTIVRDLRSFSRDDDVPLMAVDVRRVLDAAINLAGSEIRQRARIVKEFDPVPPVSASEARLGQVFLNLLVNAAHAIPDERVGEGEIHVYVGTDEKERAVVRVHDNGVGIAPDVLTRIFDPFFTTKPASVGTGLGLWICRGIVDNLGGAIEVESAPGRGTTFTIRLPTSLASATTPPPSSPANPALARGKLLIIDDEVAITQALRGALEPDYAVTTVSSGKEALRILEARADFDAVLCDLTMPDVSGMDVYAATMRQNPELGRRFLFITGGAFTPAGHAFVEAHHDRCIAKPFDIPTLRDRIAERIVGASARATS